jgi:pimeloyl-ACP methyl ester carboxylesterase
MSRSSAVAKIAGVAMGAAAGLAGAAYASERVLASRLRKQPDGDASRVLDAPVFVDRVLDSFDGGSIYLVEAGDGPPILFSHGVTNSNRTWTHQMDSLPKAGFRVIAYDHRGHGRSTVGTAGHSIENLALDLRTVIEELDLHDVVLVGHSMGGVAVQAFVTQFPELTAERVAGIVLLSTLAKTPLGSLSTRTKARIEKITKRAPDMGWVWSSPNLGLLRARVGFGDDPKPSHVELARQMLMECPRETRLDAPRALIGLDLTDELPKIQVPTLVIGGTADVLTPPAQARLIARLSPGARLELFAGGGHMLMLERTEGFERLLVDFAREVQGRTASGALSAS